MNKAEKYLLESWEESYKRGQLTLWILLSIRENSKTMQEIKDRVYGLTGNSFSVDDKSMYRALRRYVDADLIDFNEEKTHLGPSLKSYRLTTTGRVVLEEFMERNVRQVFYNPEVKKIIKRKTL